MGISLVRSSAWLVGAEPSVHQLGAAGGRSCRLGVSRKFPRESVPVNFVLGREVTACAYVVGELSELPGFRSLHPRWPNS